MYFYRNSLFQLKLFHTGNIRNINLESEIIITQFINIDQLDVKVWILKNIAVHINETPSSQEIDIDKILYIHQ